MTYRDLLNALSKLSDDQLDNMDVTVYLMDQDEFYPIVGMDIAMADGMVLDDNHPYLVVNA